MSQPIILLSEIIVNPEYLSLVPRMSKEDDESFDESVKEKGITEPLTINDSQVLLDGHSRYAKAQKYNIKQVPFKVREYDSYILEKQYVIECNLNRRHLTNYQKIELAIPLLEIEKELAKDRKQFGKSMSIMPNHDNQNIGKAVDIVAKKIGVSSTTLMKGNKIIKDAPDKLKKKLRDNTISINSAYQQVTRPERNLPKVDLPSGQWSVIHVDLPIEFDNNAVRGASTNNYDTMSLADLKLGIINDKDIRDLFADDCVIFAWFQASTIFYAKDILSSWGFECVTNIVWDKDRVGNGYWLANQHEHLVIARKGNIPIPSIRLPSLITKSPNTKIHSKKPVFFYDMIENDAYPKRKYLDLFSRYQHNENWTCFGNQLDEVKE